MISWLAPDRARVGLAVILTTVVCLLNLPTPILVQGLVDRVVTPARYGLLPLYLVGLFAVFGLQAAVSFANTRVVGRLGQGIVRELRHRLYDRIQRLGLTFYDRTPSGSIIARLMDDVSAIQVLVTAQTVQILTDLGTTVIDHRRLPGHEELSPGAGRAWRSCRSMRSTSAYFMARIRANSTIVRSKMDLIFGLLKERIDGYDRHQDRRAGAPPRPLEFSAQCSTTPTFPASATTKLSAAFSNISAAISGVGVSAVFAAGAWEVLARADDTLAAPSRPQRWRRFCSVRSLASPT